jgi:endonuclease/exonuclease/phosphatase family metal-dependent hydrolase
MLLIGNRSNFLILFCCLSMAFSCTQKSMQGVSAAGKNDTVFSLRVLCYNIHHANPPSRSNVIDLEAIAHVIRKEQPHLVALQEVDVFTGRSGKTVNQAEALAQMTGMHAYFARAIDYDGGEYGVAILSRFPMEGMKNTPLPTAEGTKGEPRTLASAVINLPGGKKLLFASTHLDAQRQDTNRYLQINKIVDLLKNEKLPVIIAGDFNAVPGTRIVNTLDGHFTRTCVNDCGFTIPEKNPAKTIDYIAFKPSASFHVLEHKVIDEKYASDHLPVFAVIGLK